MDLNIESFSYSVLTAIVGMSVVFASLGGLSILMYLLRIVVEPRGGREESKRTTRLDGDSDPAEHTETSQQNSKPLPVEIVLAGAIAHLQYETRERESTAAVWSRSLAPTSDRSGGWQG